MSTPKPQKVPATIEHTVEIAAPVEAVWKALTDAEELARWFPLEARVVPGPQGKVFLSWGADCEGEAPISAWEENRHLQIAEQSPGGTAMAQDYYLEARGGVTVLRFVHSGFGAGADWEQDYYDSLENGWGFMFINLRHYLERHPGRPRLVAWPRVKTALNRAAAWQRLAGPQGPFGDGIGKLRAGGRYALRAVTGDAFEGTLLVLDPPRKLIGTVEAMNDALVWVNVEGGAAAGHCEVYLWLSAYAVPQKDVDSFTARWQPLLEKLFPERQPAPPAAQP